MRGMGDISQMKTKDHHPLMFPTDFSCYDEKKISYAQITEIKYFVILII